MARTPKATSTASSFSPTEVETITQNGLLLTNLRKLHETLGNYNYDTSGSVMITAIEKMTILKIDPNKSAVFKATILALRTVLTNCTVCLSNNLEKNLEIEDFDVYEFFDRMVFHPADLKSLVAILDAACKLSDSILKA